LALVFSEDRPVSGRLVLRGIAMEQLRNAHVRRLNILRHLMAGNFGRYWA
jgi:hypothetical protein